MPILTPAELRVHLPHEDFDDATAESAIRLISGWLLDATGLDVLPDVAPDPDPDPLWSAAVELAGLVLTNPESLASKNVGPTSKAWPQARQRDAILAGVRARYRGASAAGRVGGSGFGSFPAPSEWPDPPTILPPGQRTFFGG